ncbi:MAG: tetratricopeptide repeat protein [bacterium]
MRAVLLSLILPVVLWVGCAKEVQKHFNAGDRYFEQGLYTEAIEEYKKAIEIKPDWAVAHNNLGLAYAKSDRGDLALQEYHEAIKIDPNLAEAHYNLASVYYDRRSYAQAIGAYKRALKIDPLMAEAHYNLGAAYYETEQYALAWDEAIEAQRLGFDAEALFEALNSVSRGPR